MGLYYRIWVDFIRRARENPANMNNWKQVSMLIMTMAMTFNLMLLLTILERYVLKKNIYKNIDIAFLPHRVNSVLTYLLLFFLPCLLINYIFIFRNKRYMKLIDRYPYYSGKLAAVYCVISFIVPALLVLIGFLFF